MVNPGIDGSGRSGAGGGLAGAGGSGQRSPAIPRSTRSVGGVGSASFGGGKGGRIGGAAGMTAGAFGSAGGAAGSDEARLPDLYRGGDSAFGNEWETAEPGKASRRAASDGEASGFTSKPSSLIRSRTLDADTLCGEDDDDPSNAGSGSSPSRPSGPDGPVGNPRRRAERSGAGNRPGTGSYLPIYRQIGVPRSSSHDPASVFAQKQLHAAFPGQEWEEALKDGSGSPSGGVSFGRSNSGGGAGAGGGGGGRAGGVAGARGGGGASGMPRSALGGAGSSPFSIQGKVVSGAGRSMMMPPRNSSVPASLPAHKGTATGLLDSARGGGGGRQLRAFASAAPGRMDGPAGLGSELGRRDSYNLILDQFLSTDENASGPNSPATGMGTEERRGPAEIGAGVELRRVVTTGRAQRAERGGTGGGSADILVVESGGDGGNADGSLYGGGRMQGGVRLHGSNSFHGHPSSGGAGGAGGGGGFDGTNSTTAPPAPAASGAAAGGAASAISHSPHSVHHPAYRHFPRSSSDSGRKSSPGRRASPSTSPSRGVGGIGGSNLAPPPLVSPHHHLDGGPGLGMGAHSAACSWTGGGMGGGVVGGFGGAAAAGAAAAGAGAAGAGNGVSTQSPSQQQPQQQQQQQLMRQPPLQPLPQPQFLRLAAAGGGSMGGGGGTGTSHRRGKSEYALSSGQKLLRQSSGSVGDGVDYSSSFESYSAAAGADVARDGTDGDSDHGQVNGQRKSRGQVPGGSGNGRQKHRRAVSDNECAQPGGSESGEGEEGGRGGVGEVWADGQGERGRGGRKGGGEGGAMHGGGWEEGGEEGGADGKGTGRGGGGGEEDGGGEEEESESGSVVEWALAGSPQSISAVAGAADGGRGGGGGGREAEGSFRRRGSGSRAVAAASTAARGGAEGAEGAGGAGGGAGEGAGGGAEGGMGRATGGGAGGGGLAAGEGEVASGTGTSHLVGKQYALTADDWFDHDPPGDGLLRRCVHRASGSLLTCRSISKQSIRQQAGGGHWSGGGGDGVAAAGEAIGVEVAVMESQQQAEAIGVEVAVMEVLQPHAHIIALRDKFESLTSVHLILDPVSRLSLHDRMRQHGPIPQHHAAPLCLALLHALHHCHSQGVAHRNLTPHAVVFPSDDSPLGDARLSGFECAAFVTPGVPFTHPVTSPLFAAPEVHAGMYGTQADLWSLGVLLFLLLCGVPPFWAATAGGIRRAVQQQQVAFLSPRWKDVSDEMKQLLLLLLEKNPADRLTAVEALVQQQQQVAFLSPRWKDVSDEMKQLLLLLLEKNPSERLTAAEALAGGIRRAVQQQQVAFLSPRWKEVSDEMKQLLLLLLEKNPANRLTAAEALAGAGGDSVCSAAAAADGVPVARSAVAAAAVAAAAVAAAAVAAAAVAAAVAAAAVAAAAVAAAVAAAAVAAAAVAAAVAAAADAAAAAVEESLSATHSR
ncbi:unnamed protein product [Closterium sp. Naga37s-1]|nr:unnamed protein product [Closterium sp. Naga37s-1]